MKMWISTGMACGCVLGMVTVAGAQQTYRWTELYGNGALPEGAALSEDEGRLVVSGKAGTPTTVRLLTIDDPDIKSTNYGISGQVAYTEMEGEPYLEMWNVFPDGSRYFTRTLSARGPMGKLTGSNPGRKFVLPFNRSGTSDPPVRLEINLVLPGVGVARFEDMTLHDQALPAGTGSAGIPWWLVGTVVGGIGAVLGIVTSRRHRNSDSVEARKMKAMDV